MLRDLATSVLLLGTESIWLLGALQSARTLASSLERQEAEKKREGGREEEAETASEMEREKRGQAGKGNRSAGLR